MTFTTLEGPIRVRFAPSPTGELHAGGLRTALFNYLLKRSLGGQLILRLEDTDLEREIPGAAERIMDDLTWSGISFEEGASEGGPYAPYSQSERTGLYQEAVAELIERGGAYRCWCTPQRLDEIRNRARREGAPPRYDGHCRRLTPDEREQLIKQSRPSVVRLASPETDTIVIKDIIKERISFRSRHLDDPILQRSDGRPTAILAGAVDDHLMQVTYVIRGEEWLPSTPYQELIYRFLNWKPPHWAHLPLLLNEQRGKLAKRDPGGTIAELRRDGFLPEALNRYLVSLGRGNLPPEQGWDIESLTDNFTLTDYRAGDAIYSLTALRSENARLLRQLPETKLVARSRPFLAEILPETSSWEEARLVASLSVVQGESVHLRDMVERLAGLLHPPEAAAHLRREFPTADRLLQAIMEELHDQPVTWEADAIKTAINRTGKALGLSGRNLFAPIRLAITGTDHGPELPRIAELIGRSEFLRRIEAAAAGWKAEENL